MRKCDVGGQAVIEGVMMRGIKRISNSSKNSKWKNRNKCKKNKSNNKKI